jgi:type IV pilus assembly protein PilB
VTPQIAAKFGLPFDDLAGITIPPEALQRLTAADARRLGVIPLKAEGNVLTVATSKPDDFELEQKLCALCRSEIDFIVSPAEAIAEALKRCGDTENVLEEVNAEFGLAIVRETEQGSSETIDLEAFGADAAAAPVVRLVNEIIRAALQKQASDIHIHSRPDGVSVDFRVDGVLMRALGPFDPAYQTTLVSRIKVMAELDIAEHRVPQDGRFRLRGWQGDIDFRVSVLPGVHGEDIVIRVLDKAHLMEKRKSLSLDALGYEEKDRATLARIARAPAGMLLVTGPTGSGKTTTLYACLSEFSSSEEKVITIEDPVEYELPGVLQIPIAEKKGLTFARGLRSVLRHDPDKIMVGEIRDRETASIAVQAALTGHLVFTTVHANNAFDVISRFTHMEIDLHELVAALSCVVAQRLLRKLCPACSRPRKYREDEIAELGFENSGLAFETWREARGCDACFNAGYQGRTVAAEILVMTPELRQMIVERRPADEMRQFAAQLGVREMREAAVAKARHGVTTLQEVVRVT